MQGDKEVNRARGSKTGEEENDEMNMNEAGDSRDDGVVAIVHALSRLEIVLSLMERARDELHFEGSENTSIQR